MSEEWREQAVCASADPETWFPDHHAAAFEAKRICLGCPVRLACLEFAMTNPVEGVWGGTTLAERRGRARSSGGDYRTLADTDKDRREQRVTELHAAGLNDHEIAARMRLHSDTVQRIRSRLGLKPNLLVAVVRQRRAAVTSQKRESA